MGMEEFFASLPTGKEDKPLLFGLGPLEYDFHDIDGLYFMLDRRLSGCLILMWAKPMDPTVTGRVTLDGREVRGSVLTSMMQMNGMWILGVPLRGLVTEYEKAYTLRVEGYRDTDGNVMNPQDFTVTGVKKVEPLPAYAEHEAVALQAATEGIVLLENKNGLLPLKEGTVLNLFGKGIYEFRNGAVGAGKITPRYSVDLREAIADSEEFTLNEELCAFYSCDEDRIPPEDLLARAKAKEDLAVLVLTRPAGENMDSSTKKGEYYLTDEEDALLAKLAKTFSHTVVILNVGYPIDVRFVGKYGVDALLYTGFGGMLAGPAVVNILSGRENPSGRLTDTWARDYFDIPASRNFYDCVDKPRLDAETDIYVDTCYEEDIYVGYRYFTSFSQPVAYPFGCGLSYTQFVIEPSGLRMDAEGICLEVHVKNMGARPGKEVVQIYVGKPDGVLEKPEKELVWFEKTCCLEPKQVQTFQVRIPKAHLTSYSEERAAYLMEAGEYRVYVGHDADAWCVGTVTLAEEEVLQQVTNLMRPPVPFRTLSRRDPRGTFPQGSHSGVQEGKTTFAPYAPRKHYPARFHGVKPAEKLSFDVVRQDPSKADDFTAQLSVEELARLSVCASAGWGMEGIGEAGRIYRLDGYDLPEFLVSDGNSGVNLRVPNIGMPSGVTIASSFNKELAQAVGRVIGEEAKALGMPMILAPAFNIHRNPLNGRQPEYFSEDPYQAGVMAGYYTKGLESAGVASSMKHLMANNCESTRKRNQSLITERAIREIYFRTFQYAMEIQMPSSFMTAYNAVNGVPTAADEELLEGLLREENGFDGFVMTDWTSYDTVSVPLAIAAGNGWMTPGSQDDTFTAPIVEGVRSGTIPLERLQENVSAMLRTIARYV